MEVYIRRRELWIFILSVLVLGGEIGLIANILFTEFYRGHEVLFLTMLSVVLLLTIFSIIKLMLVNSAKVYESNIIFAYDTSHNRFIDIPYNPSSVNARVLFDNLGNKNQEKIKVTSIFDKNNKGEFINFNNNVVAQLTLAHFIKHQGKENQREVTVEKLKELLIIYRYLDVDDIIGNEEAFIIKSDNRNLKIKSSPLSLPKGFKINSEGIKNIKIKSKYGFVNFTWDTMVTNDTKTSQLLSTYNDIDLSKCLEIQVKIKLEYGYSVFKLFMKESVEYNDFVEKCKERINDFSIEASKEKFNNDYSQKSRDYIDKCFEHNFDKIKQLIINK